MNAIDLHAKVWSGLQARRGKLPHSLLLVGQKGLGKFELARRFAASLLCESPTIDGLPCDKCLACNWFEQGNHPDFRLLQPDAFSDEAVAEDGKKSRVSRSLLIKSGLWMNSLTLARIAVA
jgi:DNA polymerase-3 subunit delta'